MRNINSNLISDMATEISRGKNLVVVSPFAGGKKILSAKLFKCANKKLTSSPGKQLAAFSAHSIVGTAWANGHSAFVRPGEQICISDGLPFHSLPRRSGKTPSYFMPWKRK